MKKAIFLLSTIFASITFYQCGPKTDDKLAVGGYDVVSYYSTDGPVKGNETFTTDVNGKTYYFSNKESLNEFTSNPDKYIPQYGGYCAYAVAEKKIKMGVDPEVYEIRDGKLYLFYNSFFANKLNDWQEGDTKALQAKGDKNWEEMKNSDK
ncbi:YHS domain-containing (seleno)protein [Tenacibaculum sp. ZS6-P6]|uniref:YHS domain-containing (seleno)protein n=1 Tax=Tenacibaculum sp. ZS6-P6 TaxID=3447503 RepID=UPI003F9A4366